MSDVTEARVREVLNGIIDPCSTVAGVPAGMDDMGMISEIRLGDSGPDGRRIGVGITLTDPTCMLLTTFVNETRIRLSALPGVTGVDVTLDHETEWTEDRLAPHYRQQLDAHRAEKRRRLLPLTPVNSGSDVKER
ncbi:metal-sulfur cluster assembly factor [Streptomyces sp. NPDC090088]|uniref:metal-sulfur cluster assembly factor n=1 Tax=Streptomyces sp. NPDC090088 TaxID=3365944 RepID=UPI003810855A